MNEPIFSTYADATLNRVRATYGQRGQEYADTWGTCPWTKFRATAKAHGVEIPEKAIRSLAAAVFCDMKNERNAGGYKEDSPIDEIAYLAMWVEEMRISLGNKQN